MKNIALFIATLLFFSCINENALKTNFPIQYLHGNSAKVWILSSSNAPDDKSIRVMDEYKKSFIFYYNGTFREQELIHLGSNKGYKGKFRLNETVDGEIMLTLNYTSKENSYFIVKKINNRTLSIKNIAKNQTTWNLSSLNPPQL